MIRHSCRRYASAPILPSRINSSSCRSFSMQTSPLVLIDFDLTITTKDTTSILGEAALRMTGNPTSWSFFTDAYMDDYRKHRGSLPPSNDTSIEAVARRLDSYRHVEAASVTRISEHQVFRGLTKEQLRSAGIAHQHLLRPGVLEALQLIPHLKIVSLNWSKDWILGMLDPLPLQRDQIHCNDLEFQHELATGLVVQRVLTTMDKKKEVQAIKDALSSSPKKVIYIGDSLGDLLPLVEADIGIVIGNNETLLSTLTQASLTIHEGLENIAELGRGIFRIDTWQQLADVHILE